MTSLHSTPPLSQHLKRAMATRSEREADATLSPNHNPVVSTAYSKSGSAVKHLNIDQGESCLDGGAVLPAGGHFNTTQGKSCLDGDVVLPAGLDAVSINSQPKLPNPAVSNASDASTTLDKTHLATEPRECCADVDAIVSADLKSATIEFRPDGYAHTDGDANVPVLLGRGRKAQTLEHLASTSIAHFDATSDEDDEASGEDNDQSSDEEEEEEGPRYVCCKCRDDEVTIEECSSCDECGHDQCEKCKYYKVWDCCMCPGLQKNTIDSDHCESCGRERCFDDCKEWIGSPDEQDWNDDEYRIEMLVRDVKVANPYGSEKFLPSGGKKYPSINQLLGLNVTVPPEISDMILKYTGITELPGPRTIVVVWDHQNKVWHYKSEQNEIPDLIYSFGGIHRKKAEGVLTPTPDFGAGAYSWFNYQTDTLKLCYNRCGNSEEDRNEYNQALRIASRHLDSHRRTHPTRKVRYLEVEWCQHFADGDPEDIIDRFIGPGLKDLTLDEHCHFNESFPAGPDNEMDDYREQMRVWMDGDLCGYECEVTWKCHRQTFTRDDLIEEEDESDEEADESEEAAEESEEEAEQWDDIFDESDGNEDEMDEEED